MYFRNILEPFGQLEDSQWKHLSDHSIRPDGKGGYGLHYDRRLTLGFQYPSTDLGGRKVSEHPFDYKFSIWIFALYERLTAG